MILNRATVAALWISEGGPPDEAGRAAEVSTRESRRDTKVVNRIGAVGIMQIYDGHYPSATRIRQLQDPRQNMREAVAKYKAAGGWSPWVVCGSQNSCPTIPKDANAHIINTSFFGDLLDRLGHGGGLAGPPGISPFGDGGSLDMTPDLGIGDLANAIKRFVELTVNIVKKLGDPATWLNAGKVLLGFILLTMALRRLFTIATT